MDLQKLIEEQYKEHEPFYCKEHALAISKRNVYERIVRERSGEGEVVATIWDNKRAPTPIVVPGVSGGEVIGVALFAGLTLLGYGLYRWLSNDDVQTSSNGTSGAPSVSERLDRIEERLDRTKERLDGFDAKFAKIEKRQNETKAILARLEVPEAA